MENWDTEFHSPVTPEYSHITYHQHCPEEYKLYSLSVIDLVAAQIGVDPAQVPLHLDEFGPMGVINSMYCEGHCGHEQKFAVIGFRWGDYTVGCCCCGRINVFAHSTKIDSGTVQPPSVVQEEIRKNLASEPKSLARSD